RPEPLLRAPGAQAALLSPRCTPPVRHARAEYAGRRRGRRGHDVRGVPVWAHDVSGLDVSGLDVSGQMLAESTRAGST
ncbi:hypothetical protein, partial [Rathayibacter tanaceti]|uniref:hypothetical protein n=1 Tax=Rathayibacter tanaceti TaxID=1671680 RepID=UPI001F3B1D54